MKYRASADSWRTGSRMAAIGAALEAGHMTTEEATEAINRLSRRERRAARARGRREDYDPDFD